MFQEILSTWVEPLKFGRRFPYIAFGRKETVDFHEKKEKKEDPDVWLSEERVSVSILDVSGTHADGNKVRYYIRKGLVPFKWFLPESSAPRDDNQTPYVELSEICEQEQERTSMRQELDQLKAEKVSLMDQRVDEAKERAVGRNKNTRADQEPT